MSGKLKHISILVLVAGISGAGKSKALDILADLGFYTVENLPLALTAQFLELSRSNAAKFDRCAILHDIDSDAKVSELLDFLKSVDDERDKVFLIFLDSDVDTVLRRYSETRRPHPAYRHDSDASIEAAISREKERFIPLKERANLILDTTRMTVHDLKRDLAQAAKEFSKSSNDVIVNFLSFGFKHGVPQECDLVVDVRFLPNPFFVDELREKTGLDKPVADYVIGQSQAKEFIKRYSGLLNYLLPHYVVEGKAYVTIGIGCTGGQHRSVAIAESLAKKIDTTSCRVAVKHRDMHK